MKMLVLAVGVAIATIGSQPASAASAAINIAVSRASPLQVTVTGVMADCTWPPGTAIMTLGTTGGDGKAVTYTFGSPAPTDLAISGNTLIIGATGITKANCGTIEPFTINATQP